MTCFAFCKKPLKIEKVKEVKKVKEGNCGWRNRKSFQNPILYGDVLVTCNHFFPLSVAPIVLSLQGFLRATKCSTSARHHHHHQL